MAAVRSWLAGLPAVTVTTLFFFFCGAKHATHHDSDTGSVVEVGYTGSPEVCVSQQAAHDTPQVTPSVNQYRSSPTVHHQHTPHHMKRREESRSSNCSLALWIHTHAHTHPSGWLAGWLQLHTAVSSRAEHKGTRTPSLPHQHNMGIIMCGHVEG